jgi:hypothetical protein
MQWRIIFGAYDFCCMPSFDGSFHAARLFLVTVSGSVANLPRHWRNARRKPWVSA